MPAGRSLPSPRLTRTGHRRAINQQLPLDLWCTASAEVNETFHPRHDARSRTYRYYYAEPPKDPQVMEVAAREFLGEHNFSNLARVGDKNPWRKILDIKVGTEGRFVYLEVKAESFLWHQVRCMAAALYSVGIGEQDTDGIRLLLNEATSRPIQPAPAEGLVLWDTDCGLSWVPIEKSDRSGTYCADSGATTRSWSRCAGCSGRKGEDVGHESKNNSKV